MKWWRLIWTPNVQIGYILFWGITHSWIRLLTYCHTITKLCWKWCCGSTSPQWRILGLWERGRLYVLKCAMYLVVLHYQGHATTVLWRIIVDVAQCAVLEKEISAGMEAMESVAMEWLVNTRLESANLVVSACAAARSQRAVAMGEHTQASAV